MDSELKLHSDYRAVSLLGMLNIMDSELKEHMEQVNHSLLGMLNIMDSEHNFLLFHHMIVFARYVKYYG